MINALSNWVNKPQEKEKKRNRKENEISSVKGAVMPRIAGILELMCGSLDDYMPFTIFIT